MDCLLPSEVSLFSSPNTPCFFKIIYPELWSGLLHDDHHVHIIYDALSTDHRMILLPVVYCLTGCDTVSSFWGHGKRTAFKIMMQKADQFKPLALLGSDEECISKEVEIASSKIVGNMCGKTNCISLNAQRCQKAGKGNIQSKKLPPTEDAFSLHLISSAYQVLIWRQAVNPSAIL